MNKYFLTVLFAATLSCGVFAEHLTVNPPAGSIRALKNNVPTGKYGASRVEAKLNVEIKEGTKAVHFIRDNNDPYVVSKAYVVKNADPYILRGVLMTIVAGSITANPTAIECIVYNDGESVLMISAEEYRFKDVGNGMTMDQLVASLDKKDLPNSSGTIDMAYFPKYRPAGELLSMMQRSGIGFSGARATDGKSFGYNEDGLHVNPDFLSYGDVDQKMNAIIMTAPGFDMTEGLKFLKQIDTPIQEISLKYQLVEIYAENDQKLGVDFQAWKNNDGVDLFTAGGKYSTNWGANGLAPNNGYRYTEFYNFNPKWNSKYLDFLTTCGKAKIVSSGTLAIANGGTAKLHMTDGFFTVVADAIDKTEENAATPTTISSTETKNPDGSVSKETTITPGSPASTSKRKYNVGDLFPADPQNDGFYSSALQELLNTVLSGDLQNVKEGNTHSIVAGTGNLFTLKVSGDVHTGASNLDFVLSSSSIIGWDGQGKARLSTSTIGTTVQVFNDKKEFVIGGLTKTSLVRGVTGLPFLKDIPILGWVFSTESESIKKSQFVLVVSAEVQTPDDKLEKKLDTQLKDYEKTVNKADRKPISTLGFQQYGIDTKEIK